MTSADTRTRTAPATYRKLAKPGPFALGLVVMTPGATAALFTAQQLPLDFLLRHAAAMGASSAPRTSPRCAAAAGSSPPYRTRTDEKLSAITEWDRSVTTLLLPAAY